MSVHLSSAVWKLETPDAATKLVLLKLADNANDDGVCWPSLTTITKETGLDRSTVCRKLAWLVAAGMVVRQRGLHKSTEYRISVASCAVPLVAPRGRGSRAVPLEVVAGCDQTSRVVRPEPSLNRQVEPSVNLPAPASPPATTRRDWRTENRKGAEQANALLLPLMVPLEFKTAWQRWCRYRTERACDAPTATAALPWGLGAAEAMLRSCERFASAESWDLVCSQIDEAIAKGYKGPVFEARRNGSASHSGNAKPVRDRQ